MALGDTGPVPHDRQGVYFEDSLYDVVATAPGQVVVESYTVAVSDGQLDLRLVGMGGVDPYAVIAGLDIRTATLDSIPKLSIGDVSVNEGDSGTTTATFTVSLSAAPTQPVSRQLGNR